MSKDRSPKQPPVGDDRNLVVVDDDFVNADAEDRLWLFWERNKSLIVQTITAIVIGIIMYQAYYFWDQSRLADIDAEFIACQDDAARRAFAEAHNGSPLAAVALVEVADKLKLDNKFADAAKAYDKASQAAALAPKTEAMQVLLVRTRLYSAFCRYETGDATALNDIAKIAEENNASETLRGFAMLTLANIAVAKGDSAEASKWLNTMDKQLGTTNVWKTDKDTLIRTEPSLLIPVKPAATKTEAAQK